MVKVNTSFILLFSLSLLIYSTVFATDYHIGPGQALTTISAAPWATLSAGDRVYIHWRSTPYKEKWVINRQGTANNPIQIIGVNSPNGEQPVIDGNGAVTAAGLNYWNENRGVIKIGGSNTPNDGLPSYITIENLEICSARPPYSFINDNGHPESYINNAASIYVEKGEHIIIRNCTIHDSGNGIFIGAFDGQTKDILIEQNYIHNNGNIGSAFEHNTYTAAIGIIYQFNRFGPLRSGANGNNIKDRSAGLIVRYNWIESGNRQLDLVDAEDSELIVNDPAYHTTHVYGNILIEPDGAGNSQVLHYGGDGSDTNIYRKGTLYFYNNTVISTRTGNTTLMRLSTNDEAAEVFNNVIFTTAGGNRFAMIDGAGSFLMQNNWLKTGWVNTHGSLTGSVQDLGDNITGNDPLFQDINLQDFTPLTNSPLINKGDPIPGSLKPVNDLILEYVKHQNFKNRNIAGLPDIGAYELSNTSCSDTMEFVNGAWTNGIPDPNKYAILKSDYHSATWGNLLSCGCTIRQGNLFTLAAGDTLQIQTEFNVEGQLDAQAQSILIVQSQ